ncbi:hypothetical protein VCCP1035_2779B, partial [Vibrio cholerae CP1035(8)]|jgi:hypothetical protein
VGVG